LVNATKIIGGIIEFCSNQKWITEQTGTSIAMIQENYGRYIRDDGDALVRAYIEKPKLTSIEQKTETFSRDRSNYRKDLVRPTGIEPGSIKNDSDSEEFDVIDISKLKKAGE
jgi:hypothetical protein